MERICVLPVSLSTNITPDSMILTEWQPLRSHQARFIISMFIVKAKDDGPIFQGPDTSSHAYRSLHGIFRTAMLRCGRVSSSFVAHTALSNFAALLIYGMTDIQYMTWSGPQIDISGRIQAWAHTTAVHGHVCRRDHQYLRKRDRVYCGSPRSSD
ncbi:hypothetical protein B0H11DRAFT_1072793 [Mycena galericulata]|nr:hypothetical protein B0H11DRAFT_1072793 [Mycena galericulata]